MGPAVRGPGEHGGVWAYPDAVDGGEGRGRVRDDAGWGQGGVGDPQGAEGGGGADGVCRYPVAETGDRHGGRECHLGGGESVVQLC